MQRETGKLFVLWGEENTKHSLPAYFLTGEVTIDHRAPRLLHASRMKLGEEP